MHPLPFGTRLEHAVLRCNNPVCVGLDPRLAQLPGALRPDPNASLQVQADAFERFCKEIIDVVARLVPVVKPQSAFFEELGGPGCVALERVVRYATQSGLLVIMDGKRNDIGTTATAYANAYLGSGPIGSASYSPWGADALTVSPYLGSDSIEPFIVRCQQSSAGIFVLAKTSNPGSGFIQDLVVGEQSISERVADLIQSQSMATRGNGAYGSIGAVVGATYPEQLVHMRQRMPNAWLLIPGYGAQGGTARDVALGLNARGLGAIVNSSRGIIFAHESAKYQGSSWQSAVEQATRDMIAAIHDARQR